MPICQELLEWEIFLQQILRKMYEKEYGSIEELALYDDYVTIRHIEIMEGTSKNSFYGEYFKKKLFFCNFFFD
jgi:hypothetical protein